MARRDPEKQREYERRYREKHREEIRERDRQWRANPENRERKNERNERAREYQRRYQIANAERKAEYRRQRRLADPERIREMDRQSKQKNAERVRAYMYKYSRERRASGLYLAREKELGRQWRARNKDRTAKSIMKRSHGILPEDWAALWAAQDGRCYLCGEEMHPDRTHIDHDHRCCPAGSSCAYCRRGLAHQLCNALIGMAEDDVDRLRLIADNLEIALKDTDARLAEKPEQGTLL